MIDIKNIEVIAGEEHFFNYPSGLAYDKDEDNLYITDLHNHRVCCFNMQTREMTVLTRNLLIDNAMKLIEKPLGITFKNGALYITDAKYNSIFYFCAEYEHWLPVKSYFPEGSGETLNLPSGVCVGDDGSVYTNDFLNNRIIKIQESGLVKILAGRKAPGFSDGFNACINKPYGICLSGERLYFADTANHALRYIDLDNYAVKTLVHTDNGGALKNPIVIVSDADNGVFLAEQRKLWFYFHKSKRLHLVFDRYMWEEIRKNVSYSQRLAYVGAMVMPESGSLIWADTLKGVIYKMNF